MHIARTGLDPLSVVSHCCVSALAVEEVEPVIYQCESHRFNPQLFQSVCESFLGQDSGPRVFLNGFVCENVRQGACLNVCDWVNEACSNNCFEC